MVTMNHDTGPYNRSPTSSLPVIERLTKAAWYRSKAMIKDVLEPEGQDHLTGSPPPHRIPPEIWMKIIAHFAYDARTLKACARTCFTWYNIAIPYLYHTLNFKQWDRDRSRTYLNPLLTSHKFGLLPFAKQVQFGRAMFGVLWVAPDVFDGEKLQYFRALENLQDLTIADLDFKKFPTGTGDYFGHFWSSLRSVTLIAPRGARRELLDFFRLFPKLDHIGISHYESSAEALDAPLPVVQGRLRGRLTLENLSDEVLLRDMIVGYGGLSFDSIVLHNVQGAQPLLEACASSLKMLQIRPSTFRNSPPQLYDVSRNTALECLEVSGSVIWNLPTHLRTIKQLLSTITSPAFFELVVIFSEGDVRWRPRGLDEVLREMYKVKKFRLSFCLETVDEFLESNLFFSRTLSQYDRRIARDIR